MKGKLLLLTALCISFAKLYSQELISPKAFNKMMLDYYNFSLVGSQTPATGFKVETNKPSIALKGNIFSDAHRSFIVNLELEGGLENGIMQLFDGNTLNTYFKGSIGANILMPKNQAKYVKITATENNLNQNAYQTNKSLLSRQLDTFAVIKRVIDDSDFQKYTYTQFVGAVENERNLPHNTIEDFTPEHAASQTDYLKGLAKNILFLYGAVKYADGDSVLASFKSKIETKNDTSLKSKELLVDYDRLKELLFKKDKALVDKGKLIFKNGSHTLNDRQYDFEINLTKVLWTVKIIRWVNISLNASNSNFKLYDAGPALLSDSNSFLPSISASYNWLRKRQEAGRFSYYRFGLAYHLKTNSLADMQKYNYKKETTIAVTSGEELKSTKEGVAYQGIFVEKPGFDVFAEWYCVPWNKAFIPGFYLKAMYRNSDAWINKNKFSGDIGMVWNVANNDKDAKNLLTIVPYVSWSNFIKEYKDAAKTRERKLSDLFSVNVKFTIPVNLGK